MRPPTTEEVAQFATSFARTYRVVTISDGVSVKYEVSNIFLSVDYNVLASEVTGDKVFGPALLEVKDSASLAKLKSKSLLLWLHLGNNYDV